MIAAYQRISRADGDLGKDGKDKSNSIENQKELIQRYISHKESLQNLPVMDFVDDGYTGSNFDRPGFQKMMDGVRSGEIDTIIVKDLSRFGRDYIGVGEYMEQIFPLLGVRLISINDNYDSSNYNGTTLGMDLVVSNLVNTMYCRDAGKKLRTANRVKWRKGISTASAAPFGYQFDPNRKGSYIIDPPAAKIVRRIFDLAILGLGTREIAMALNDENAPVPSVYNREHGQQTNRKEKDEMSITRKLAKRILTLLTLPLLVVVWLLKWFVTFLHCCSAWIFYLLGSVLLATAVLSFLMKQSQGIEALQMLIGGFVIFMIPQVVGSVVVFLELAAATIRQVWYI